MFKKIHLDHCYNEDHNFAFLKKLGKLGFIIDPQLVEHPGKAYCKFISLQANGNSGKFYLEFIHIGKGGEAEKTPGLSFRYLTKLEEFSKKLSKVTKIIFFHKNYDWKTNSTDRLPGWNMIFFNKKPINNIFTWFTENEPRKGRSFKKSKIHPNSVYSIHGIKLVVTKKSKENLEKILGKKIASKVKLSDGSFLYVEEGKKDLFESIILNCKSLKKASYFMRKEELVQFGPFDAIKVVNCSVNKKLMWDLLIIEN